jgi:hypothetical protein
VGRWQPSEELASISFSVRISRKMIVVGRVQRKEVNLILNFSLALRDET